ncbi:hypothetical protein [Azospirillum sp. TSO35-2]|uniref:hypothetical protein n=1 Tax=Azospirillum sp. TSO35-2 TaxID=716796 RepID=UPI000D605FAD|nr:hypothetical protein [Azospirillum sp. TSO35-2]PWC37844.1 hypothetical protein TSO352_10340 [Azospirillum sp. TSO35-2]
MPVRFALVFAVAALSALPAAASPANDYPTEARADYVIGCMMANGQSHTVMQKCACSIDAIADRIPYDDYTAMETVKVMGDLPGERASLFRGAGWAKDLMDRLRQAQIAADRQCF